MGKASLCISCSRHTFCRPHQHCRKHQAVRRNRAPATAQASAEIEGPPQHQQQQRLDDESIKKFVAANGQLSELLGSEDLVCQQLFDGVINVVYKVQGRHTGGAAIIKQALPYVRAVGESFPLSRARMDVEAAAMQLVHGCCPAHIPRLLAYDAANSVLAMQCAPPPHMKLLYCIQQGQVLPGLSTQLAELLSACLAHTSLQLLQHDTQVAMVARFANTDIVTANERVVLQSPFDPHDATNRWSSPALDADVRAMWADAEVAASAAAMLEAYRTCKEALIHNDLHAGNLLAAPGSLFLIDWEFATVGPVAFDVGCLLGNLMLAVLSLRGMAEAEELLEQEQQEQPPQQQQQQGQQQQQEQQQFVGPQTRRQQAQWLLQVMQEVWEQFVVLYPDRLERERAAAGATAGDRGGDGSGAYGEHRDCCHSSPSIGSSQWQQQLLADSCGYAGCCLVRLTIGLHHYPAIQSLTDDKGVRTRVERACLRLGQQLLLLRGRAAVSSRGGDCGSTQLRMADVQELVREACGREWLLD